MVAEFDTLFQNKDLGTYGFPLTYPSFIGTVANPRPTESQIVRLAFSLSQSYSLDVNERYRICFESWLFAIRSEFPSFFNEKLDFCYEILEQMRVTGKHIKLSRIATAKLAELL